MLVISTKKGESVAVAGESPFERLLTVTILDIGSNSVRLGFDVREDGSVYPLEGRRTKLGTLVRQANLSLA